VTATIYAIVRYKLVDLLRAGVGREGLHDLINEELE
jgi:hypothetical protein